MVDPRFEIQRSSAELMEVFLSGTVNADVILACDHEVRAALSVAKPGRVRLLIDLSALTEYTLGAREALIELQDHVGTKVACTAYVADSAERRGLALWVAHVSNGQAVKCFATREQASQWLRGLHGPVTSVRVLSETGDAALDEPDKAAG